ncbi:MAG: hypothetical protein ILP02_03000 [Clostridia bacterium]|nr:hypothetical protein [Clostridia bacterium]
MDTVTGTIRSTSYVSNGITITTGGNVLTVGSSVALGEYEIPVTIKCDNWISGASAIIKLKVISPLTLNGEDLTGDDIVVKAGANNIDMTISSDYYAFMDKNSDAAFICMPAYNDGSGWKQRSEDESASDIITLNYEEIKDLATFQAREPSYAVISGLPEGVTATVIVTRPEGYCGLTYTNDIQVGLKLTGTLAAGEYDITVQFITNIINKPTGGNWIRATSGTQVTVTYTLHIVVEE